MKRKLIAFLCILSMSMSLMTPAMAADVQALEKNSEEQETITELAFENDDNDTLKMSYQWKNPIYSNVDFELNSSENTNDSEISTFTTESTKTQYITNIEEAGSVIRAGLVKRENIIEVNYQIPVEKTLDNGWFAELCNSMFLIAYEHTNNPKEGDSLAFSVGGYSTGEFKYSGDGTYYYLPIKFTMTYHTNAEEEALLDSKVQSLMNNLALEGKTNYEKIKAIYNYMCENITYDYNGLADGKDMAIYSAYGALCNKKAVCQGYATLFYRLALEAGVDVRVISGTANNGDHAWNIVKLDDKYYNLDSTWDAGRINYCYFLKCNENFEDHVRDNNYLTEEFNLKYPMSEEDYSENKNESEDVTDETFISVFINETEGAKFVDSEGNNLTDVLTPGDEENEYLVSSGTTLKFKIQLEDNYRCMFESFQNENGDLGLKTDEDGYYTVSVSDSSHTFSVWTKKVLWYESVYETYFSALGLSHEGTNKYISSEKDVDPAMAFWFLKQINAFSEYLNDLNMAEMSYETFINIVSAYFVTPSDMKTYMTDQGFYNVAEDKVTFYSGNSFGSEDMMAWKVLSTYESENKVTVTGLYLCGVCEDLSNLNYNMDYSSYYDSFSDEYYNLYIKDIVEMTLVNDESNIKIDSYEQADYYIIEDTLYAYNSDRTEISSYNKIETISDNGTEFKFTNTYTFEGNKDLWYKASEGFSWTCNAKEGYQFSKVYADINGESNVISDSRGKVEADSGTVSLTSVSQAELTVNAEYASVTFDNITEKNGVYLFDEGASITFSVTVDSEYTLLKVTANGDEVNYLESFGKYQLYPEFGPVVIEVLTEKNEDIEPDEPDTPVVEPDTTIPVAVIAPEDIIGTTGEAITFSGVNSMDNVEIASYEWDFGDDSTGTGAICKHTYATGGTYTVTLKVTDTSGNEAIAAKEVFVYGITGEDAEYALMTIKTIDGYTEGTPVIGNVNVQITAETEDNTFETMVLTDKNGEATAVVPRTSITVAAIADGYSATSRVVNVIPDEEGKFSHTLSLSPAGISLVDGSIKVEEMTLDEIKDAGIEIENPENQQVVRTELQISFEPHIGSSFDVGIYSDGEGNVLGGFNIGEWITVTGSQEDDSEEDDSGEGSSGSSGSASGSGGSGGYSSSGSGRKFLVLTLSEKMFLVIHGETHWLKEMYNVDLIVLNNSRVEDLTDCVAELELPEGLSLAKMMDEQQSATVELGTIEKYSNETGYHSRTHTWYVCGDEMGEYNITVNVSGNAVSTDGSTNAFKIPFTTTNPVRVYAGSALHLTIRPQDVCYQDEKYYVNYSLKNVSNTTLYNLSLAFTFTEQYELARMTDGTEEYTYIDNERFGDEMYIEIEEFEPGQSVDFMFCTTTWFEDDFMEGAASIIPLTDAEYRFRDAFLTFAESSTTTIPYTIELWKVEKDGFWEWIDGECRKWEEDLLGNVAEGFFVTLIDSRACKKIPVTKYGVKVMKYVIGENTHHDIESEMVVTPGNGVEIVESGDDVRQRSTYTMFTEANADTYNSDTNVVVYTDVPYEMSEDGKSMVISEDATLYIARVDEGEANLSVTTCYYPYGTTQKDTYTQETITYELISDSDEEYSELLSEAVSVEIDSLETTEFDIHYKDTETVIFPALYMAADGYYHLAASNALWSVEGEDTTGLEIIDGTLYISKDAKEGDYTVKVTLEGTDVVDSQEITLKKLECEHSYTNYISNNDAACTSDGTETAECDNGCGTTDTRTDENSILGHDLSEWSVVTTSTYTKEGLQIRNCTRCDYSEEQVIPSVKAESITLDQTNLILPTGEEVTLKATCLPIAPAEGDITWTSSDESVATVDVNGKVTAVSDGTATITAKVSDITAACEVTVITAFTPEAPASFKVVLSGGHDDVKLTWKASEYANGYYVYYKKSTATAWSKAINTTATTYTVKDLADNVKYDFKVVAYYQDGENIYFDASKASTASVMTTKNIAAPSSVKAVLYGYDDVKLTWTKSSGAVGYYIYYKKSTDSSYTSLTNTTALTYKKANLADGVKYTFKVVPYYKNGTTKVQSYYSKTASIYTLKKLSAPTVKKASSTKITVSWQNISGESGYQLSQSTSKTGTSIIATTTAASKTLTVTRNKNYYYKVRAYKTVSGTKIYGPWSSVTSYNLRYVSAQGTVTAALYGYDDVKLSWKKVTGANSYDVYYKKSSASSYTKLGSTTGTSYKKANLADGVKYTFKVVPTYKSSGKIVVQGTAKTVSITTLKKLNAPTISKSSSTKVKVAWNNIGGETGYQISQSTSKTGTKVVSTYATTSGKSKTVAATKGKTYYYKVRAYKTVGSTKIYGAWSDVTSYKLK